MKLVSDPQDSTETALAKLNRYNDQLTSDTMLTAGQPLVVHDLIHNRYDLLYINADTQLKYLSGYGLSRSVFNFDAQAFNQYRFYNYKQNEYPTLVNSYIDWDNTYTTILSSVSSINEGIRTLFADQIFSITLLLDWFISL